MDGFQQAERHSIARILNQLVDQQQQNCSQFQQISLALESIRAEIRRTDENHHKEVERLQEIINKMLQQQMLMLQISSRPQTSTPVSMNPQQGYNATVPPSLFQDQMMAMKAMQQQALQQQQAMQQAQLAQFATMAPPSGGLSTGFPSGPAPVNKPPLLSQTPLKAPPVPSTGTVTLPISTTTKIESPKMEAPKMEVKKEVTPSLPTFGSSVTPIKPSIFEEKAITSSQPKVQIVVADKTEGDDEDEAEDEEYEPNITFKPVIPLPALIDVVTGEEGELEVFKEHCKLYRYASETKEWKERGTGDLKILKDPKTGGYRVVMRREQVHKLCANFKLTKGMSISIMGKNTKACAWHCHDFSEEEGSHEQLSAKFASAELSKKFMDLFMEGVSRGTSAAVKTEPKTNDENKSTQQMEETKETKSKPQEPVKKNEVFGAQFIKKDGEWDCTACYSRNKGTVQQCPCCGLNKDGTEGVKSLTTTSLPQASSTFNFGFSSTTDKPAAQPKFTFGLKKEESPVVSSSTDKKISFATAASVAAKEEPTSQSAKAPGFGAAATNAPKFSFSSTVASSTFGTSAAVKPVFSFAKKEDASSTTQSTTASPISFSFKGAQPQITPSKSIFGSSSTTTPVVVDKKDEVPTSASSKIFGQGSTGTISFSQMGGSSLFDPDAKKKAQEELAKQKQSKFGSNLKKDTKHDGDEEQGEDDGEEYEPEVDFKPVIPLPDLIEVKTGEEDESVVFKERCKLYRYAAETKEWKERGIGDIKILKDPKTNSHRIVMRREQTHKLCANLKLTKSMTINAMSKNAKAAQWICQDYSEGELKMESLSAKFASPELTEKFINAYKDAVNSAN